MSIVLANSSLSFLPPLTPLTLLGLLAAVVLGGLALGKLLGTANAVSRRWSLWILRGVILVIVALVLFNPVQVDELPGPVERPEMFYLLDTSSSMQIGSPRSRWDEALARIDAAHPLADATAALVKPFRFGQRLLAVAPGDFADLLVSNQSGAPLITPAANVSRGSSKNESSASAVLKPTDGDTRLLTALRQISSRFGRAPPRGIVVFSDGRARDDLPVAQLAQQFARLKVPIHVAPVGDTSKGGDVAIAAVVVPPRVRKFTEVEAQVFIRSFGYDGKRSTVQLLDVDSKGNPGRTLASLPITLQSGFQSVSLTFRTEISTRRLRVAISPLSDEVTERNNLLDTEIAIDRTKIRILYIEGSRAGLSRTIGPAGRVQLRGPFSDLKDALTEDEDIECVVLVNSPTATGRLSRIAENSAVDGVRGFPSTMAELAAFDAIILSNVAKDLFTDQQVQWLEQWIGQRGGGLCMIGGENSFASGGWTDSPLAAMLPVEMLPGQFDWLAGETVKIAPHLPPTPHVLWNLLADDQQNREVVAAFPAVSGINRWAGVRPSLSSVLATTSVSGVPVSAPPTTAFSFRSLSSALAPLTGARPTPANRAGTVKSGDATEVPAIATGRYGRGRTLAVAIPLTPPHADDLVQKWGVDDNRYFSKFARNLVYWLTESSAIGRRRLVATADKRFYRPGDTISVQAATYDESAAPTKRYRVVAMIEPHTAPGEPEPETAPLRWPEGLARTSGESGPFMAWGEEFELALGGQEPPLYKIQLPLAETLASGQSNLSLRLELTAYEDLTQVDSSSLDIQILHDPFEQQNPFPNHELLRELAAASGGKVLRTPEELAAVLNEVSVEPGEPIIRRSPLWSNSWVLTLLLGLLTVEWCWRRTLGLA